jgi:hypothetical protein
MERTRSRSLVPWALHSHRNGAITFGAGLALLVAITGPSYVAAAKAIAGGLQTLGAQAGPIAQQFAFLTGPVARLDTVGGYLSYKVFGTISLIVALYAAVQGAQIVRGSESKGLLDLWFAAGRSRSEMEALEDAAALNHDLRARIATEPDLDAHRQDRRLAAVVG